LVPRAVIPQVAEALGFTLAVAIYILFLRAQWYWSFLVLVALVLASFILAPGDPRLTGTDCCRVRGCNDGMAVVARVQHCSGGNPELDTGDPGTPGLPMVRLFVPVYYPTTPLSKHGVPASRGRLRLILENIHLRRRTIRRATHSQSHTGAGNVPAGNCLHSHV
jgi:hypothetical protein